MRLRGNLLGKLFFASTFNYFGQRTIWRSKSSDIETATVITKRIRAALSVTGLPIPLVEYDFERDNEKANRMER